MLYRKIAVPWTARMADMIITISHASKKDIVQRFKIPKEKVKVVYCGVDERFGRVNNASIMEVKKKYNVPDNYILFVGTVDHPGKNVLGLIMSCERLWRHKKMHNKLVLVGKKGYRYETILDYISINNLQEYIIHLGYVDDSDLPAIYSGAKLFCFLSYYEGFGLPVLEAMASGVPVIVSNRSSLPEIVSDAGKVVEIEKLQEISDAIMTILENHQLWKELSKMGKLRAEEFNWNSAGEKTIKVFEKMLES
jgi:glycosyltransferase involved in cell wall biosynthesis